MGKIRFILEVGGVLVAGGNCGIVPVEQLRHCASHHHAPSNDDSPATLDGDTRSFDKLDDSCRSTGEVAGQVSALDATCVWREGGGEYKI